MSESTLQIGVLFPEVLGTYGDSGNALVLRERALRRGISAQILTVPIGKAIPDSLDIYTLGGGEDKAQALAAEQLRASAGIRNAVHAGHPLLAICAGMQVLGHWYEDAKGNQVPGVGLLDVTTIPQGHRSIGELVSKPLLPQLGDELLTGFENHGGTTRLGSEAKPLGKVLAGNGNGLGLSEHSALDNNDPSLELEPKDLFEGVVQGSILATYMHGPALARNPHLADYLLAQALNQSLSQLPPLEIAGVDQLRTERLAAVGL